MLPANITPANGMLAALYLRQAELPAALDLIGERGLGAVGFGGEPPADLPCMLPRLEIAMPQRLPAEPLVEIWLGVSRATWGRTGAIHWACDGHHLFGSLQTDAEADIRGATARAYDALFRLLEQQGYPHLVRVWNYFPGINREESGLERYRQFNIGRQEAFLRANRPLSGALPAACALGTHAGPLVVYFVAARIPLIPVENPRQLSAYRYPPAYGPRSPSFSRATVLRSADQTAVFVSGTASILGHMSVHPGDAAAQTRETLMNLAALVETLNGGASGGFTWEDFRYKVYVRPGCPLEPIKYELAAMLPAAEAILIVEADICRRELLVEIEAFGSRSLGNPGEPM
ncbi:MULTISPECIES: hypothetical protein [Methylococcus]|uniref:Chorismatase FkbO/Hyg5-like N-terminal domain-containing protein n=1 Tax=Methylococcus capsulatus TaxID=414 RepID=A0ABZ2F4S4_METCP|nr:MULTISPECIES: hypothetical protein [Methylococcus]MDF9391571.1 hypothetical protein [Methylococcus capsulatus]